MKLAHLKNSIRIFVISVISIPLILSIFLPTPVHAAPNLTLNPASNTVGSIVQVSGKGFSGRLATLYFDDKILATKIVISETGDLSYDLTIPTTSKGTHTIRVTDNSNWSGSIATVDFMILPQVTVFPGVGTIAGDITIIGNGFKSNESDIKMTLDGNIASTSSIAADRLGSWSIISSFPKITKGEHYFGAFGSSTSASEVNQAKFIFAPYVKVTPISGPVGTQIKFYGWGFRGNEDGISITWDGELIRYNIRAELDGSLLVDGSKVPNLGSAYSGDTRETVLVPPSTRGRHIIGVYGSSFTPKGTLNDNVFEVIPDIKLQPEPSIKGTQVTINGGGFASSETITISIDKTPTNTTATTDSTGSFNSVLTIPTSKGKEYIISALGNKGNSAVASFIGAAEQSLPTELKLISPAQGAKLVIFESVGDVVLGITKYLFGVFDYLKGSPIKDSNYPKVTFTWAADSFAETSYVLQISSDLNFSSINLDKKIVNYTEYKLSVNDHLASGHYSWRVKAVDNTGQEGLWSQASEFDIVSMSPLVAVLTSIILVLIVAAIVFGVIIVWFNLNRR